MKEYYFNNSFIKHKKLFNQKDNFKNIKIIITIILLLFNKLNKLILFIKLFKEIKNEEDVKLYMRNKTKFYYKLRIRKLKMYKIKYNESNLITFQDKLNYLTIHESPEYKSNFVDKIKIHKYTKKILGKDICVPIIKIYKNANEINLEELPNKFVLKLNHGSGMNIICKDKNKFDFVKAKRILNKWKNINYGLLSSEFQYFYVKRKIFVAPFLGDKLIDYQFYCFNGIPKFIRVHKPLLLYNHTILHNYYNLDWTLMDIESGLKGYFRIPQIKIKKPKNINLMLYYSKILSNKFVFVRIDFYEVKNKVYLSEMTFTPSNTLMKFKNKKQSKYLGNLLDISKIKLK